MKGAKLPSEMRAVVIDRHGGPEVMKIRPCPLPLVKPGDVLIAVHTAGVAVWDAEMREGWSPTGRRRLPFVLGTDGSGVIVAVGSRVRRFKIGDRVYACSFDHGGFYADYISVSADTVAPSVDRLGLRLMGAVPITGVTSLQGIQRVLRVRRGESIAIHGAAGGVGSLALQFAKARGARVLASVWGEQCVRLVRRLGAHAVLDVRRDSINSTVRRFSPDGVDAVLTLAGGDALEEIAANIREGGRLAYPRGVEPRPRRRPGLAVISFDGFVGVREFANLGRAMRLVKPKIAVAAMYPLAEVVEAHRRLERGHVPGKIVLKVR